MLPGSRSPLKGLPKVIKRSTYGRGVWIRKSVQFTLEGFDPQGSLHSTPTAEEVMVGELFCHKAQAR